jgi:hypothetical protein
MTLIINLSGGIQATQYATGDDGVEHCFRTVVISQSGIGKIRRIVTSQDQSVSKGAGRTRNNKTVR